MIRFPSQSGCWHLRPITKLIMKVGVSRKKIAFFVFHRLVPPTGNMGETKRVRSDRVDMAKFWQAFWTFLPPPLRTNLSVEGMVATWAGSQIDTTFPYLLIFAEPALQCVSVILHVTSLWPFWGVIPQRLGKLHIELAGKMKTYASGLVHDGWSFTLYVSKNVSAASSIVRHSYPQETQKIVSFRLVM